MKTTDAGGFARLSSEWVQTSLCHLHNLEARSESHQWPGELWSIRKHAPWSVELLLGEADEVFPYPVGTGRVLKERARRVSRMRDGERHHVTSQTGQTNNSTVL